MKTIATLQRVPAENLRKISGGTTTTNTGTGTGTSTGTGTGTTVRLPNWIRQPTR